MRGHVGVLSQMQRCIDDLHQWMLTDRLKLNDEKTEFLLVGTSSQELGLLVDQQLSMVTNINKICSASYFYLHNIRRIRNFLSVESTKLLVHALVTSRIDYCNSLNNCNNCNCNNCNSCNCLKLNCVS